MNTLTASPTILSTERKSSETEDANISSMIFFFLACGAIIAAGILVGMMNSTLFRLM